MDGLANDLDKFWRVLRFSYPHHTAGVIQTQSEVQAQIIAALFTVYTYFSSIRQLHIELIWQIWFENGQIAKFKFSEISSQWNLISQPQKAFLHWPLWPSWLVIIFQDISSHFLGKNQVWIKIISVFKCQKQFPNQLMHFSSLWIGWSSKIVNAMMVLEGAAGPSFNQTTKPPRTSAPPFPCAPCPPSGPWRPARAARAVI